MKHAHLLKTRGRVVIAIVALLSAVILSSASLASGVYAATLKVVPHATAVTFVGDQETTDKCITGVTKFQPQANTQGNMDRVVLTFTKSNSCGMALVTLNVIDKKAGTASGSALIATGVNSVTIFTPGGTAKPNQDPAYYILVS